ncbi:MAG: hypothetical protein MUC60_02050, partial [Oscillatoria sp. Prado101]|nr:hypothetical protein [Oscillatoria sp. Prado101]
GAWGLGLGAWGMGHGAWGMGRSGIDSICRVRSACFGAKALLQTKPLRKPFPQQLNNRIQ